MNIGIFYKRYPKNGKGKSGYLYTDHPQWRNYPHELLGELQKRTERAVVLCKEDTYDGKNIFKRYWLPSQTEVGFFEPVDEPIRIDGIFDKGYFRQPAGFSMVNVPGLAKIGRDKATQNKLFGDLQPKTITIDGVDQLEDALDSIKSSKVVVKPTNLNGGRGVFIGSRSEIKQSYIFQSGTQYVLQQFVDSSKGVSGLVDGVHDLRLYIVDGEATFASIRTPKAGSLVANTSQGGTIRFFDVSLIPEQPKAVAREVDKHMQKFGNRYYSVDFVNDGETWHVIEINDRPGVPARFQSDAVAGFHQRLAACIIEAVNNPKNHVKSDA